MIFFDFVVQLFFALVFFAGISGIGILVLDLLKIKRSNVILELALGFFASLCLFSASSVLLLFVLPNKLATLAIFTILYFLVSFLILARRFREKGNFEFSFSRFKGYWGMLATFIPLEFSFFLLIYKTSLLDEWLHRPIIKFFLENGIFPLKNPYSPTQAFTLTYHYGTQIIGAALKLIFPLGISESLDVMKLAFLAAAFLLFFGMIYEWSGKKWYSLLGAVFVILCGGSFFLFDNFSSIHLSFWDQKPVWPFNFPLAYALAGITWVNLPLAAAFTLLLEKYFFKNKENLNLSLLIFAPLVVGFFLISELFGILMVGFIFFSIFWNLAKKNNSRKSVLFVIVFLLIFLAGILFTGGVIGNIFKGGGNFKGLATFRNFFLWGYPQENGTAYFFLSPSRYLRDFLLEFIILVVIAYGLVKKRMHLSDHPLFFLSIPIMFAVPFVLSTSMGDLNLSKLTAFGILVLHLLIFYYFSLNKRGVLFWTIIVLFIFGSLPAVMMDFKVQYGKSVSAVGFHCLQNDLCYDPAEAALLMEFEKNNPGLKYFSAVVQDQQIVIDLTNSFTVGYSGTLDSETLKEKNIEYIFDTPNLENQLDPASLEKLKKCELVGESGNYRILRTH